MHIPKQQTSKSLKHKRKLQNVVDEDAQPQEGISSRLRQKPKLTAPHKRQRKEKGSDEIPLETLPRLTYAKLPFKAVRGEGNSFHGWSP